MLLAVVTMCALSLPLQDNAMVFPIDELLQDIPADEQKALALVVRPPDDGALRPAFSDVQHGLTAALQSHAAVKSVVLLEDPEMARGKPDMEIAQAAGANGMDLLVVARVQAASPRRAYPDVTITVFDTRGVELRRVERNYSLLWRNPLAEHAPDIPDEDTEDDDEQEVAPEDLGTLRDPRIPSDLKVFLASLGGGAACLTTGGLLAATGLALFIVSYPVMAALGQDPAGGSLGAALQLGGCGLMAPLPCFVGGCVGIPLAGILFVVAKHDQGRSCGPIALFCANSVGQACFSCLLSMCCSLACGARSYSPTPYAAPPPPPSDDGNPPPAPTPRKPKVRPRRR